MYTWTLPVRPTSIFTVYICCHGHDKQLTIKMS